VGISAAVFNFVWKVCKTDDLNSNNLKAVFKSAIRILIFQPSDADVILSLSGDSVISGCHFILNSVMVWNMKQISWFSPWQCMLNSFKLVVKSTKNAKSLGHFLSPSSGTNFPFDSINHLMASFHFRNHRIFLTFYSNLATSHRKNKWRPHSQYPHF